MAESAESSFSTQRLNSHLRLWCSVVAAMSIEVSACRWLSACLLAPLTLSLVAFSGLLAVFQRYDTHRFRIFLLQFRWHFSFKCYEYLFMLTEHLIIELIQVKNTKYRLFWGVFTAFKCHFNIPTMAVLFKSFYNQLFTILFLGIQKD